MLPGGLLLEHHWEEDTLFFVVQAFGQRIAASLEVLDTRVHALLDLPPFAAMLADFIRPHLLDVGTKLLR
jgi:hypothetical protein